MEISVFLFQESNSQKKLWIAQSLEYDILAQGRSKGEAITEWWRLIAGTFHIIKELTEKGEHVVTPNPAPVDEDVMIEHDRSEE